MTLTENDIVGPYGNEITGGECSYNSRETKLDPATVIRELLGAMEIQERRASQHYHISAETMKLIWNSAKANAKRYLEESR